MREMSDEQFKATARELALGLLGLMERKGISGDDAPAIIAAALGECLAQLLGGVFPAVERMRDIADIWEGQALGKSESAH